MQMPTLGRPDSSGSKARVSRGRLRKVKGSAAFLQLSSWVSFFSPASCQFHFLTPFFFRFLSSHPICLFGVSFFMSYVPSTLSLPLSLSGSVCLVARVHVCVFLCPFVLCGCLCVCLSLRVSLPAYSNILKSVCMCASVCVCVCVPVSKNLTLPRCLPALCLSVCLLLTLCVCLRGCLSGSLSGSIRSSGLHSGGSRRRPPLTPPKVHCLVKRS